MLSEILEISMETFEISTERKGEPWLEPFSFEEARHIFENPDSFDIRSLGRKKTVLFLNVSDTERVFSALKLI